MCVACQYVEECVACVSMWRCVCQFVEVCVSLWRCVSVCGGVCGGGVVGERAPALCVSLAEQQKAQLWRHAAGEGRVDPGVGARVQTGQQHEEGKHGA